MTLRRGVTLSIALAALVAYGLAHTQLSTIVAPTIATDVADTANTTNAVSVITEPDATIAPIQSMIEDASSSVDLVMYQLEDTGVEQALAADVARGLTVRVLLNGGYYGKKENTDNDVAYQYLSEHDVAVHWTPSYFALTHQKTLVIDDSEALIMTMNLTPQYYASSREFDIVDRDGSDVGAIKETFDDDWNGTQASASDGDDLLWSPGSESALLSLINDAQHSLDIYNEEMADPAIISALEDAAQRGVSVRIDMTYSSEWKKAFAALTEAGAQVRTYAANAPLYIHAKAVIADQSRAFIGSENFSTGSLAKNRELGIIINDAAAIDSIEQTFEKDWSRATAFSS